MTSCHINAFARALPNQSADESLYLFNSNDIAGFITLGLKEDDIEAKGIFGNDSINTAIVRSSQFFAATRLAITHCEHEIDNKLLEEIWRCFLFRARRSLLNAALTSA